MVVLPKNQRLFEYAVLATSLPEVYLLTIAQQYRDRGDAENIFDELKNQWRGRASPRTTCREAS